MDSANVQKIVSEAVDKIRAVANGTIVTHLTLEEMTGVSRAKEPQRYYRIVSKIKKELQRDCGLFLSTEQKLGYKITERGKEIDLCDGKYLKGIKQSVKAISEMQYIRVDEINNETLRNRTIQVAQSRMNTMTMLKAAGVNPRIGENSKNGPFYKIDDGEVTI